MEDILRSVLVKREFESGRPNEGVMPYRCHYMPAGISSKISLGGEWEFLFIDSCRNIGFTEIDSKKKEKIRVPGCWQAAGYDKNQYVNIRYPIPFNPPFVPMDTPFGYYKRTVNIKKTKGFRYYLNFDGVCSFFYLFINRKNVGYFSAAHLRSEFDVTDVLKDGGNVIEVIVMKWSFATYFEDQDRFRVNGIFRDVYILCRPENCVWDYRISSTVSKDLKSARLKIRYFGNEEKRVSLIYDGGTIAEQKIINEAEFFIDNVDLWSAENPVLYDIKTECNGEIITNRYAVRKLELTDGEVLLNGKSLKIHGVNRHETIFPAGEFVSAEDTERDLIAIKKINANAVRCCHYPNSAFFYELCDKLGLYVIDEADIETHGALWSDGNTEWFSLNWDNYKIFSEDTAYAPIFRDRIRGMVTQDFNFGCILFWSLGNESGWGENFANEAHYIRKIDAQRLIHYENLHTNGGGRADDEGSLDIIGEMYYMPEKMKSLLADVSEIRPFLLCEYSHAMGNSCGDLEDYETLFKSDKRMIGGCVWEFADHAVKDPLGRPLYGGESGEFPHDGNFCVDGLFNCDRTIKSSAKLFRNLYSPIRTELHADAWYISNRMSFKNIGDEIEIKTVVFREDGINEQSLTPPDVPPLGTAPLSFDVKGARSVLFEYYCRRYGEMCGFDHFVLSPRKSLLSMGNKTTFIRCGDDFYVQSGGKTYVISSKTGLPLRIATEDKELLSAPARWNVTRALIDNDLHYKNIAYDLTRAKTEVRRMQLKEQALEAEVRIQLDSFRDIAEIFLRYEAGDEGLMLSAEVKIGECYARLPRFGIRFFTVPSLDTACYYGFGPDESYADKKLHTYKEYFQFRISGTKCPYLKPQEYGGHFDCEYLSLYGADGNLSFEGAFSFSALPYSQEQLSEKKHNYDLINEDRNTVCIDYAMEGVGSDSCGTVLSEKYRFTEKNFVFRLMIK